MVLLKGCALIYLLMDSLALSSNAEVAAQKAPGTNGEELNCTWLQGGCWRGSFLWD